MYEPGEELKTYVQSLPKTETHLHLEGSCPLDLLDRYAPGLFGETPFMWADDFRYESFTQFTQLFAQVAQAVFTTPEAFHECAKAVLQNCADQNCRYVECSFHIGVLTLPGMHGPEVVDAILDAAPDGMEVRVFVGMRHNSYDAETRPIIDDCINWANLTGIDLHGPEDLPVEPWTVKIWEKAGRAGKFLKTHAGEFMPASFVRYCIETLGTQRIEHGVRSIEDPAVIELIKERGVILDVCPISNLKLQVDGIPEMRAHPIRKLFDQGVACTINTDDTLMFGNTLSEEYYALAEDLDFTKPELAQIALNGFECALWDGPSKIDCIEKLQALAASK
ncbi:MAG: adenosine deaminase family protein [Verrucomicrobiota bacterium]